ncbi:hypothetical protein MVG78_13140 [Roseomonas gilardii subsp. gilardii]|uniref:hypothetical protein n=1 Tax=Roseomonas gilardii TaxID=257708 RepID=UPI001FFAC8B5|nr:hypothetical protein [Roseomonas gilardii]UPG71508.1 hypothetical protein MVG78_13140 [Roseomonas gilardii subsp. gilardii]
MHRRQFLPLAGLLLPGSAALAAPRREAAPAPKPLPVLPSLDADGRPSLTPEKRALVEKVRTSWRAADGRSAEEIVAALGGMVRGFRALGFRAETGWPDHTGTVGFLGAPVLVTLVLSHDKEVGWHLQPDGRFQIGPDVFQLGALAYAVNWLQEEEDQGGPAGRARLRDPRSLDFLEIAPGRRLGALLADGGYGIRDLSVRAVSLPRPGFTTGGFTTGFTLRAPAGSAVQGLLRPVFTRRAADLDTPPQALAWEPGNDDARQLALRPPGEWRFTPSG